MSVTSNTTDQCQSLGSKTKIVSHKQFTFWDEDIVLAVEIPEVAEAAYGMYTWPCAPVLAEFVFRHRQYIYGKYVLEIGSGTALCGVVAAKCGAHVILSDSAHYPDSLKNCRSSCLANGVEDVRIIALSWGLVNTELIRLPPVDVILGSDCFYDTKDFEDILVTVSYLLKRNPKAQFWCTYQKRSTMRCLEIYLRKWNLQAREIETQSFLHRDHTEDWATPGYDSVHMFVITQNGSVFTQDGNVFAQNDNLYSQNAGT